MNKYYIAFKPSVEIEREVVKHLDLIREKVAPLTVTPLDRIHVTTLYMGEVPESIGVSVLHACRQVRAFDVYFSGPTHLRKKVAIIKLDRGNALVALNRIQRAKLSEMRGGDPERIFQGDYTPHLTLAKYEGSSGTRWESTSAQVWDAVLRCIDDVDLTKFGKSTVTHLGLYTKSTLVEEIQLAPQYDRNVS
jgi:2'-5' RNA ligase